MRLRVISALQGPLPGEPLPRLAGVSVTRVTAVCEPICERAGESMLGHCCGHPRGHVEKTHLLYSWLTLTQEDFCVVWRRRIKRGSMVHDDGEDRPTSALGAMRRELERTERELVRATGLDALNTEGAAERANNWHRLPHRRLGSVRQRSNHSAYRGPRASATA
jgi:hypothetical protein